MPKNGKSDTRVGGRWGSRSLYLALYRKYPASAEAVLLREWRHSRGGIRATARALGCSTNTVYAVLARNGERC